MDVFFYNVLVYPLEIFVEFVYGFSIRASQM
jgi:hypothetical protein